MARMCLLYESVRMSLVCDALPLQGYGIYGKCRYLFVLPPFFVRRWLLLPAACCAEGICSCGVLVRGDTTSYLLALCFCFVSAVGSWQIEVVTQVFCCLGGGGGGRHVWKCSGFCGGASTLPTPCLLCPIWWLRSSRNEKKNGVSTGETREGLRKKGGKQRVCREWHSTHYGAGFRGHR